QTLVEALPSDGLAILNYDDSRVLSMAARTKARVKTFGRTGGDYIISNLRADNPAGLTLSISHDNETIDLKTQLTGAHQSVPIAAAFACARELGIPASVCQERIASFKPVFGRCSVHVIENGPIFIADSVKAPYHSVHHVIEMMTHFSAPRKRIVIGQISDASNSRAKYRDIYRASRDVADQVIYVGENSHRSKATAEDIAAGRFVEQHKVEDAASFVRDTAIPGELILLKSSVSLHLERILLGFITDVRCWEGKCGKRAQCVECGLYGLAFDEHPRWSPLKPWHLDEVRDPVSSNSIK
ncbi:MAG: glutamate ligase domain-containing protein, partial [Hyphomicrobiaceae bacterium]